MSPSEYTAGDRLALVVLVTLAVVSFSFVYGRGYFVDEEVAVHALQTQGYSSVTITQKVWFLPGLKGCDEKDAVKFEATALNPAGKRVNVFVCSGWIFKGATVRSR